MTSEDYFLNKKKNILELYSLKKVDDIAFIGIDRSLSATGVALVKNNKCIESFEICGKEYGGDRLYNLGISILNTVLKYKIKYTDIIVIMEDYAFGANSRSVTGIAEIEGVLRFLFKIKNIDYIHISPTSLKKYITGSGASKKDMMVMFVLKKFGIQASSNNTADAISLAYLGYNSMKFNNGSKDYTAKEIESFNTFLSLNKKPKKVKKGLEQMALDI